MHYIGSKSRHAAEIIRIATTNRKPGQHWVEPFVGGGNVICRVPREQGPRIGADKNRYMIALLDAVGNRGWLPPETMTEAEWKKIKKNPDAYPDELVAFAATGPTFGSKWWDAWAKDYPGQEGTRYRQSREGAVREAPLLSGATFIVSEYQDLSIPPDSIIYCDPPYAATMNDQTSGYKGSRTKIAPGESLSTNVWSRNKFWRWADRMVDAGHQVYVSEYAGPTPSSYDVTDPRLKEEDRAIIALGKALDARQRLPADQRPTKEEHEAIFARRRALDQKEHEERARLAARWHVVWQKKVVSDFSSQRGTVEEGTVKEETELLLHRAP